MLYVILRENVIGERAIKRDECIPGTHSVNFPHILDLYRASCKKLVFLCKRICKTNVLNTLNLVMDSQRNNQGKSKG